MTDVPPLDEQRAHAHFAVLCFNRAWDLIDQVQRSPEEGEQLLLLAHASLWHWTQRKDCTDRNLSIGYWQLARAYALLGRADNALHYGELCLRYSERQSAFYLGYAHEALARASWISGDSGRLARHLAEARRLLAEVADADERSMLEKDLDSLTRPELV